MRLPNLPVALIFQATCLVTLVSGARNISIDDQNMALFQYTGNWTRIPSTMDKEGGHMMTQSQDAYATITYTFASVYFISALWPYKVTTNYGIDGSTIQVDMQDYSKIYTGDDSPTIAARVVGQWTSTVNKLHTIHITVPPGGPFGVVDMFTFEVLDPSEISSTTSSTSTTSSSITTTSGTSTTSLPAGGSSTSSSSSSSGVSPSSSSSGSQDVSSSTQVRNLAISMGVVGTLLALLLIVLLWWFFVRRKNKVNIDKNSFTPRYHPLPTSNMTITPFTGVNDAGVFTTSMRGSPMPATGNGDLAASTMYGNASSYGSIQSNNLQPSPNNLNHHPKSSPHTNLPSTFYSNQPPSSSLPLPPQRAQQILHNPQGRFSTSSMMNDSPPRYTREFDTSPDSSVMLIGRNDATSLLDESGRSTTAASSSSSSTRGRSHGPFPQIPPNAQDAPGAQPDDHLISAAMMPQGNEARNSVWDTGYHQPLRFIPIA